MASINENHEQIHQHLVRQLEIYANALPIAEQLAEHYEVNPQKQDELARLEDWMQQAFSENQQMQALLPDEPGFLDLAPEIKDTSRQLTEQISTMIQLFDTIERLSGAENSVLVSRAQALQTTIDDNAGRVSALSAALENERERLLLSFFRMESTISQIQSNLTAISQIQALAPLV